MLHHSFGSISVLGTPFLKSPCDDCVYKLTFPHQMDTSMHTRVFVCSHCKDTWLKGECVFLEKRGREPQLLLEMKVRGTQRQFVSLVEESGGRCDQSRSLPTYKKPPLS